MVGITSFGAYVPLYRLSRKDLGQFWNKSAPPGQKAVANLDEDSLTMGVEAAIDCIGKRDRGLVDGVYFATASPSYLEKQSASILAAAADLREEIATIDFGHSLRAGTSALNVALDGVKAGSLKNVLVIASDRRIAAPNTNFEVLFGDGAAALMIGEDNVAVEIQARRTVSSDFMDVWRRPADRFHRTWEDRFVFGEGYSRIAREAVTAFLKQQGLKMADFTKVVFNGPDARQHGDLARALDVSPAQLQDHLVTTIGDTGTAASMMMLIAALEEAKPGDRILWANYADGCDVYALRVTELIGNVRPLRGMKGHLESQRNLGHYSKYVRFRDLMEWEVERRPADRSSLTQLWRDREWVVRFHGSLCRQCGQVQMPPQRVCAYCQSKDAFDMVPLADKQGKICTFSMDELAMYPDLPLVFTVLDFDGGGRYFTVLTDRDPQTVEVGMPVELTFRKLHEGQGINNYSWKARPLR